MGRAQTVVGIDFGTSYASIAFYSLGQLKVVANGNGEKRMPAVVTIRDDKPFPLTVGKQAKYYSQISPSRSYYYIKNELEDVDNFYRPLEAAGDTPKFVAAQIFFHLTTLLNRHYSKTKTKTSLQKTAVISVPGHYNNAQRRAIIEAAKDANIIVIKLIDDAIAAAFVYYYRNPTLGMVTPLQEVKVLVLDLGSNSAKISVLSKEYKTLQIKCDRVLLGGGCDFDQSIVDYVQKELNYRYGVVFKFNRKDHRAVYNCCEAAKKRLSLNHQTVLKVQVPPVTGRRFKVYITRDDFEVMIFEFVKKLLLTIDNCLQSSRLSQSEIDDVVMVGGLMHIPYIKQRLQDHFTGRNLIHFTNPDETVVEGAAIQGALLSRRPHQEIISFTNVEETFSLPIGVADQTGVMRPILQPGTPIPYRSSLRFKIFAFVKDLPIEIYEGFASQATKNRLLGTITIKNVDVKKDDLEADINVTLHIDNSGVLFALAKTDERCESIFLPYTRGDRNYLEINESLLYDSNHVVRNMQFRTFTRLLGSSVEYCRTMVQQKLLYGRLHDKKENIFFEIVLAKAQASDVHEGENLTLFMRHLRKIYDEYLGG